MKKKALLLFLLTAIVLQALCCAAPPVFAADALTVAISGGISVSGDAHSSAERYSVELKAAEDGVPMPEGSDSGVFLLEKEGGGEFAFPLVTYARVGVYRYTVRLIPGANPLCTYDDTVYDVRVTVVNDNGGGIDVYVTARDSETEEKPDGITFSVSYKSESVPEESSEGGEPGKPQTGDDSNVKPWIALTGLSLAAIIVLIFRLKKDSKRGSI